MTRVSEGLVAPLLFWTTRSAVMLAGIFLSVIVHELLHVALHWGDIVAFRVFPAPFVIAEVEFIARASHSMLVEEIAAYSLSTIVILLTIALLLALPHKKGSSVSTGGQILNVFRTAVERAGA